MKKQTVKQLVSGLNSDYVRNPSLFEAILDDLSAAGYPSDMEVTKEMDTSSATAEGTFRYALNGILCACS